MENAVPATSSGNSSSSPTEEESATVTTEDGVVEENEGEGVVSVSNCSLVGFLPFTKDGGVIYRRPALGGGHNHWQLSHMAAALMAVDHLNERSNVVVPNLSQLLENCTAFSTTSDTTATNKKLHLQFDEPVFVNSDSGRQPVSQYLIDQLLKTSTQSTTSSGKICGIVGPYDNESTEVASLLASGMDVPVITHHANGNLLTDPAGHSHVGRTTVNLHPLGEATAHYLAVLPNRTDFIATISATSTFGEQYQVCDKYRTVDLYLFNNFG